MDITKHEKSNVSILELDGRLDLVSGAELKEAIKSIFSQKKKSVHINLEKIEFINSSGLGSLVSIMKETRLNKGRLTLSNMESYVKEIFDITQLSHIFEIYDTEEEAIKSFEKDSVKAW